MKKPIILVALLVVVDGRFLVYDNMFSSEADEEFTLDGRRRIRPRVRVATTTLGATMLRPTS